MDRDQLQPWVCDHCEQRNAAWAKVCGRCETLRDLGHRPGAERVPGTICNESEVFGGPTPRAARSEVKRPARVRLSMDITRELDRKLRAWSSVEDVSMASIVEAALARHFGQLHRFADEGTIDRVSGLVNQQQEGRKLKV